MDTTFLHIYLNDHLALLRGTLALMQRSERHNRATDLGAVLRSAHRETSEAKSFVEKLLGQVGARRNRAKEALAVIGERVGRLKLNGRIIHYSPLSRLVELEAICATLYTQQGFWQVLHHLSASDSRIDTQKVTQLMERAIHQREQLERYRLESAAQTFRC